MRENWVKLEASTWEFSMAKIPPIPDKQRKVLLKKGVQKKDIDDFWKIYVAMYRLRKKGKRSWFEEADEMEIIADVKPKRAMSLIKKYSKQFKPLFGREPKVWPSSYNRSGAGAFGHRQPNMAGASGYNKAMIEF